MPRDSYTNFIPFHPITPEENHLYRNAQLINILMKQYTGKVTDVLIKNIRYM
jgi:hypothetical protein